MQLNATRSDFFRSKKTDYPIHLEAYADEGTFSRFIHTMRKESEYLKRHMRKNMTERDITVAESPTCCVCGQYIGIEAADKQRDTFSEDIRCMRHLGKKVITQDEYENHDCKSSAHGACGVCDNDNIEIYG